MERWTMPSQEELRAIMAGNPLQAAAAGLTSAQGQQAPGQPGQSQLGQVSGKNAGFSTQVAGNQTQTGVMSPTTSGAASPSSFGTGNFAYNSPEWYGSGNEYGTSIMASSPGAFWGGYAEDVMGMRPGSNAGSFLANKYNPFAIGSAMYGKGFVSDDQRLAGATSMANQIAGPGSTFFDPAVLIGNTLQALASGDLQSIAQQNPTLAKLIMENQGNPAGQVDSLVRFFEELLSATMPPDVLQAFLMQISGMGQLWFSQMRKDPSFSAMDSGTFAKFLVQNLGPTLGL